MTNTPVVLAATIVAISTNYIETPINPERGDLKERHTIVTHHIVRDGITNTVCSTNKALLRLEWVEVKIPKTAHSKTNRP